MTDYNSLRMRLVRLSNIQMTTRAVNLFIGHIYLPASENISINMLFASVPARSHISRTSHIDLIILN